MTPFESQTARRYVSLSDLTGISMRKGGSEGFSVFTSCDEPKKEGSKQKKTKVAL